MGIITTVAEVRAHIKLRADFDVNALPSFDEATATYLLPIIGDSLYSELETAHAGAPTEKQTALIKKCRAVIIPFAFCDELILRHLNIGESGINAEVSETVRTAHRWEFIKFEEQMRKKGYAAQEMLIVHLKNNLADFPSWSDSPYNAPSQFNIIRDGAELRDVSGLQQPHRAFMMLRGIFNTVAETYLKPNISAAYYDALTARIKAGNTNDNDKYILPYLRMACASKALSKASVDMSIDFSDSGFTVLYKSVERTDSERTAANENLLRQFRQQQDETARNLLEQAVKYMNENASATVFSEYYESGAYTAPGGNNFLRQDRKGIVPLS